MSKPRALLGYAQQRTETPSVLDDAAIEALRAAGWNQSGIDQATALIAFYNFSGRMESASGLPPDRFPPEASFPEATPDS